MYRSIQIDYRQTLFWGELISNDRYRIAAPEELISVTQTDLWEFQQKISHCRYRFSLELQLVSITDTDFGLKMNYSPAQNQYMQEKILGELIFAPIHAGPVFALARIQKNIFKEPFLAY